MIRPFLALWALLTLGGGTGCRSAETDPSMDTISRFLHQQVALARTPSVQYRFVGPDSVLFRHEEGVADLASGTTVSPATMYSGFSVTKTFTALAILQLAEQGALHLDDPAADHLPDFPYPREITVRQLLTHSAGIPNPIPLSWVHLREAHPSFSAETFFRPLFARHNRVKAGPNERFGYSNLGYVLLGRVIEQVSGLG
jgi:D-alanyl-D-alanine carboxypeptidase